MITFSKLGTKGNLGNQLFQVSSTIGLAKKNGHWWCFPKWEYASYFKEPLPICDTTVDFEPLQEKYYHYHDWAINDKDYDLNGWLQSENYFDIPYTRALFKFKPEIQQELITEFGYLFNKKSILISIRRGDFVHHPLYFQLSYKYYFLALIEHFPDWLNHNLLFTSDDLSYCRAHFGNLPNAYFLENVPPMEQLIISSYCDHFIISNSTFSWWQAWLGEKESSVVIRPAENHRNTKYVQFNDKDYFPERWTRFDHRKKNIPLKHIDTIFKGEKNRIKGFLLNKSNGLKHRIKKFI